MRTLFKKTQKFLVSLNYSKGLFRLWLLLTGIYLLLVSAFYVKHLYDGHEAIFYKELGNNRYDFYTFAPTFFLWNGDPDNSCITLGESFKKALEEADIQIDPATTTNKVWISQGNTNLNKEANFFVDKPKEPKNSGFDIDSAVVVEDEKSFSGPWERYRNPIQVPVQVVEDNNLLKQKYFDQFSTEWSKCANLYNQNLYRSFWKKTFQEGVNILFGVLSVPMLFLVAGAFLIRFGCFVLWPFYQAGKGLKCVFMWIVLGFKEK